MNIIAKELANNFWILEENGERTGILQQTEGGITLTRQKQKVNFKNISQLKSEYPIKFITSSGNTPTDDTAEYNVNGYPCKMFPYGSVYDVKRKLPLFTKSQKSSSYYCAGYYIIQFNNGWAKAFCPKLITLQRYEFKGPYKTQLEMQHQLRLHKQQ